MATTVSIRPNATNVTDDVNVTGVDADDALRNTSTSDWVQFFFGTGSSEVQVALEDRTLATNERCARCRVVANFDTGNGSISTHGQVISGGFNSESLHQTSQVYPAATKTGSWLTSIPGGSTEWTTAAINSLVLRLMDDMTGGSAPRFIWAKVDLDIHTQPVVSISTPASGGITDTHFTVQWAFNAVGDAQTKFRVKVFTAAVVTGGGFDPETSTNVYDSTVQSFTGTSQWAIPTGSLSYGTQYYVYVKAAAAFPGPIAGEQWYSPWTGTAFKTASIPACTPTAPTGAIATSLPTLTTGYADTDGKSADSITFMVFERPGGSWSGFDFTTATPVFKTTVTGSVASGGTKSYVPTTAIVQNAKTYRLYCIAAVSTPIAVPTNPTVGFIDFTTSWTAPSTPTLVVAPEPAMGRVRLVITQTTAFTSPSNKIERSVDGGLTWQTVRGASALAAGQNVPSTIYDLEAPPFTPLSYRGSTTAISGGVQTQSLFVTVLNELDCKVCFLKDVATGVSLHVMISEDRSVTPSHRRQRVTYEPSGRVRPVIVRGKQRGTIIPVNFLTKTLADETALQTLLDSNDVLIFQTPRKLRWVDLSGDYSVEEFLWADLRGQSEQFRIWSISFIEVDSVP